MNRYETAQMGMPHPGTYPQERWMTVYGQPDAPQMDNRLAAYAPPNQYDQLQSSHQEPALVAFANAIKQDMAGRDAVVFVAPGGRVSISGSDLHQQGRRTAFYVMPQGVMDIRSASHGNATEYESCSHRGTLDRNGCCSNCGWKRQASQEAAPHLGLRGRLWRKILD